jgi:hypothetical protein
MDDAREAMKNRDLLPWLINIYVYEDVEKNI